MDGAWIDDANKNKGLANADKELRYANFLLQNRLIINSGECAAAASLKSWLDDSSSVLYSIVYVKELLN